MRMLGGDEEAVVCAVQLRSALNSPQKRNPIVAAYNAKAKKLEGRVFKVDADLAPHKSKKAADGKVEMSYKGVIQGVIKHVVAGQKLSSLRIARVLQVQGLDIKNLPTWGSEDKEPKKAAEPVLRKTKREDARSEDADDPAKKKVRVDVTPTQAEEIYRVVNPPKPGQQPQKIWIHPAVVEFLKNLNRQLPKQVVMPRRDTNSKALAVYKGKPEAKIEPQPVAVTVNLPKEFMVKHHGKSEPLKEKTAEERGLAIVPYNNGPKHEVKSPSFTLPASEIGRIKSALGKVFKKKPLSPREESLMRGLLKKVIVLPAEPQPALALPALKPERKLNPNLKEQIEGFDKSTLKKIEVKVSPTQAGKIVNFVKQPIPKTGMVKLDPEVAKFLRALAFKVPKAPKQQAAKLSENKNELAIVPYTGGQRTQPVEVHVQLPKDFAKKYAKQQPAQKPKTAEEMGLALVPYQAAKKSQASEHPKEVVLSPALLGELKGAFGKIKANKPLPSTEARQVKGLLRALVVLPPAKTGPMLALPAPKSERKLNPALQKEIKGFDKSKLKKPGVRFENQDDWFARPGLDTPKAVCKEKTILGILTEMDFGELACAEIAQQQWRGNAGVIGAWKRTLTDRQKSAVSHIIDDQISRISSGKKSGKLKPGDENVFKFLLEKLERRNQSRGKKSEGPEYYTEEELDEISRRVKTRKSSVPQNLRQEDDEEAIRELQERWSQVDEDCGKSYQGTLNILKSKLFSGEQRQRCASLSLKALNELFNGDTKNLKGDFYKKVQEANASGNQALIGKLQAFFEILQEMANGRMPAKVIDPLAK